MSSKGKQAAVAAAVAAAAAVAQHPWHGMAQLDAQNFKPSVYCDSPNIQV